MGFLDKAKEFAEDHKKQVNEGIKKAGHLAQKKSGGKLDEPIEKGEQLLEKELGTDQ